MSLSDSTAVPRPLQQGYARRVKAGTLERDPLQERAVNALDGLIERIEEHYCARKWRILRWAFTKNCKSPGLTGFYIYGGVGRGKTMLMDLFFEGVRVPASAKRRAHFNAFMSDVQDRIARHRESFKNGLTRESDPIPAVAASIARQAWILCLDELAVTDIVDAMILSRLFSALFAEGIVLVATSNVPPGDLYHNGLNRSLFEPFIEILKRYAPPLALLGEKDYRLEQLNRLPVYMAPLGRQADQMMDQAWELLRGEAQTRQQTLKVKSRTIIVPRAANRNARFRFTDLCEKPLGLRDYLTITDHFDTIFIDHVPAMNHALRNEAKRFILLIDTIYDRKKQLFISAETTPERLYRAQNGTETLEFKRTASRLFEMQGRKWAEKRE